MEEEDSGAENNSFLSQAGEFFYPVSYLLQLNCWHSPYVVVVLIIVGGTDGQTEMVVLFLGVGVPRSVGRDVWVVLNGGWRRDERGMKKE